MIIARIAIPRPNVEETWDYIIPGDLVDFAEPGKRALVPVGRSRITGYITELSDSPTTTKQLRPILEILDEEPIISKKLLELTSWAAGYYLSSWGDMIKAALPAGINVEEREIIRLSADGKQELHRLRSEVLVDNQLGEARRLMDYLAERGGQQVKSLQKEFSHQLIGRLLHFGWIETATSRKARSLEKRRKAVMAAGDPDQVTDEFWRRSSKRLAAYRRLKDLESPVLLTEIASTLDVSRAVIDSLAKVGLAKYTEVVIRRDPLKDLDITPAEPHKMTREQSLVHEKIIKALNSNESKAFLLHGVTGSGKTEIYIHAAKRCLEGGRRVLILIPELALTPQFVRRYYSVFGQDLAVLYSSLTAGQRIDEWSRVRRGEAKVVLGTRLSIFAPADDLGLIVVDEEHDASYKQDEYPMFNARNLALVRSKMSGGVCVLGSATPSLESLHNAEKGKYKILRLEARVFDRPLPELLLVDMRMPENKTELSPFPGKVLDGIRETLERAEQTLVLVGRKGYSPFVLCRACGFNFQCSSCSITMSYHDSIKKLKCHYCGRAKELPQICPKCHSPSVESVGIGTEKVDEELRKVFPKARIARMDRDVITKPTAYYELLGKLREHEIDILVGTQMIAKGHDYPKVTTVVALGLDSILRLPDFRHAERIFQLIMQISGRAGRGDRPGKVYIMTYRPDHYAIKSACDGNLDMFLDRELDYRHRLRYPPFGHIALLTIEDYDKNRGRRAAQKLSDELCSELNSCAYILGPALAPYAKLKNRWRHQLIIKAADRKLLNETLSRIRRHWSAGSTLKINVDPVSVM